MQRFFNIFPKVFVDFFSIFALCGAGVKRVLAIGGSQFIVLRDVLLDKQMFIFLLTKLSIC